jgi:RNA polymerase sigma-70 factor (ECF subfamily)
MTSVEEIYRTYSRDIYRFARWLGADAHEADDIASETFLRLFGSLDELEVATLKAYLLTIARNVFLTRRRRSARYTRLPEKLPGASPPPDAEAECHDEADALMAAVQALPEGERAALLMHIQHDLPYDEIARGLGISPSAARVRVHRARLKLAESRQALGEKP